MVVDQLLLTHASLFQKSILHPLTNELCQGTLADDKLLTYLVQDLKFFQVGLNVMGKALAYCDDAEAAIVLGKQIGFVSNDENTYFYKVIEQLSGSSDITLLAREAEPLPAVKKYIDLLQYLAAKSTSYVELITFIYVMEKVYLGWADLNIERGLPPLTYKHSEWVVLHSGDAFTKWVDFLASEVDRVVTPDSFKLCEDIFKKTVQLEIDFFSECYNHQP